jgi:hypothetical protein
MSIRNKFFLEFQEKMYEEYGYVLDKLNPTSHFWHINKHTAQKEFKNALSHNYYLHYEKKFGAIRHKVKKVLEIGVFKGHSMLLWNDYFPNATIYGVDIDLDQKHLGQNAKDICKGKERIKLLEFNACDEIELGKVIKSGWFGEEPFDIIIDDGSHHPVHQAQALLMYMPMLSSDGTFVVEDILEPSNKGCWTQVERIENTFKLFENKCSVGYWFGEFLEKVNDTKLDDISKWGCSISLEDEKWWKNNPLSNFDIDTIPAKDYKVYFDDVDLKGGSVVMACNNGLTLTFINRIK